MKNLLFVGVLLVLGVIACKKDEDNHTDMPHYHVHIVSPDDTPKHQGDTLHIHVEFSEENLMTVHHVKVRIYNKADISQVIFDQPTEAHVHATSGTYTFQADFVLDPAVVPGHTDWVLEAKVWGHDEGVSETSETVEFHVHPM